MQETIGTAKWIGEKIECHACGRTFIVEVGDKIERKHSRRFRYPVISITLSCGHKQIFRGNKECAKF